MNMRIRRCVFFGLIFFGAMANLRAQERVPPSTSPENASTATVPDSRAQWTVEVQTSGGFSGQGIGGFTVTASGNLICSAPTPCARQIPRSALQSLNGLVNLANLPQPIQISTLNLLIPVQSVQGVCSDCIMTTMFLRIRDSKGIEWSYSVSWDPTTLSSVPLDFRQIFESAAALAK